jgi:hypothetical protein
LTWKAGRGNIFYERDAGAFRGFVYLRQQGQLMIKIGTWLLIAACLVTLLAGTSTAARRTVLLEQVTNAGCG